MSHLFFSYSRLDKDYAIRLAGDLRGLGARLWIDQLDIKPGDHWERSIENAIKSARGLLVVLSPRSVASDNVLDEISYARDHGKVILPVLIEKCEIPFRLHRLQYIDFVSDYRAALDACARSALTLLGHENPAPDPAKPSATKFDPDVPLAGIKILWVDDYPDNNKYERKMMEKLGASFALCVDTADALRAIAQWPFDLVLSDMGRPSGNTAGYELLSAIRSQGRTVPFVIYAGSNSPAHRAEAARRGAQGSTNDPRELLELVMQALNRSP